jgi:hypothetical protein
MVITVAQISQMIVGVSVTALALYFIGSQECWIKPENNMAAFVVRGVRRTNVCLCGHG